MRLFVLSIFFISTLFAGDMQQIEKIFDNISTLRVDYERCQKELKSKVVHSVSKVKKGIDYKKLYEQEKAKNRVLVLELKRKVKQKSHLEEIVVKSNKASAYRLLIDADIYDGIDGKVMDNWEARTSFTSSQRTALWVKITGYFVDKRWQKAKRSLWIKSDKVFKR